MSEWQPISTVPNKETVLAWYDGWESHSGALWVRNGFGFYAVNEDGPVRHLVRHAKERIMGPTENDWSLEATHWMRLPERPQE